MKAGRKSRKLLVSTEVSRAIDAEAREEWGFNTFSLVEAAGRSCAQAFTNAYPDFFECQKPPEKKRITAVIGTGSNGADAMVMLRYWILSDLLDSSCSAVVAGRMPKNGETGPWVELLGSLKAMKVPVLVWDGDIGEDAGRPSDDILAQSDLIIDGITGSGLKGQLEGAALEMVNAINFHRKKNKPASSLKRPLVVSVDIPSGNSDAWEPGMSIVEADVTLSIEPGKYCNYSPSARPCAGEIIPVGGIFPQELTARYKGAELIEWEGIKDNISKILPHVYKNKRGTVEIRAGSPGTTGAALIAARGAQAAGAGLIRLVADDDIYPILAAGAGGIMVAPASAEPHDFEGSFKPDAVLLGPGWGKKENRVKVFEKALALEKAGTPLILDADAIELGRDACFNGNAIITPHPGEFSRFCGMDRDELLRNPLPILLKYAKEKKVSILFKGPVMTLVAPDGRTGVIDGMTANLASGGSGDLLAGFCTAIAARMMHECKASGGSRAFCAYTCAAAASALLIASGRSLKNRFTDPLEIADAAANLAGAVWLGAEEGSYG